MTDTPQLLVRPAREEDLDRLAALEAEAFPDPWTRELLAEELLQPQAIVLTAGRPGGPAEGYVSLRHGGGEAEILRLAVDPAARRRGVARALVAAGLAAASRAGTAVCHLEVRTTNAGAIAFYETLGFTAVGRRKGYYRDGTDALVLAKEL